MSSWFKIHWLDFVIVMFVSFILGSCTARADYYETVISEDTSENSTFVGTGSIGDVYGALRPWFGFIISGSEGDLFNKIELNSIGKWSTSESSYFDVRLYSSSNELIAVSKENYYTSDFPAYPSSPPYVTDVFTIISEDFDLESGKSFVFDSSEEMRVVFHIVYGGSSATYLLFGLNSNGTAGRSFYDASTNFGDNINYFNNNFFNSYYVSYSDVLIEGFPPSSFGGFEVLNAPYTTDIIDEWEVEYICHSIGNLYYKLFPSVTWTNFPDTDDGFGGSSSVCNSEDVMSARIKTVILPFNYVSQINYGGYANYSFSLWAGNPSEIVYEMDGIRVTYFDSAVSQDDQDRSVFSVAWDTFWDVLEGVPVYGDAIKVVDTVYNNFFLYIGDDEFDSEFHFTGTIYGTAVDVDYDIESMLEPFFDELDTINGWANFKILITGVVLTLFIWNIFKNIHKLL